MLRRSGDHLRGLAPGQHSFEETSQRWRAAGDTVSDWPVRESNPGRPHRSDACNNWAITEKNIFLKLWVAVPLCPILAPYRFILNI